MNKLNPISPKAFFDRAFKILITLFCIQLTHLSLFANTSLEVFVVFFIFYLVLFLTIYPYKLLFRSRQEFFNIDWKLVFFVLIISFIFKIVARFDYIVLSNSLSLYQMRSENVIENGGGFWSYLSVFFYPASILIVFSKTPRIVYKVALFLTIVICSIDFLFVGTRGAPMMVLLIWFVGFRKKIDVRIIFALFIILFFVFDYTTVNRSQVYSTGGFDWVVLLSSTVSTEILGLNEYTLSFINRHQLDFLYPIIFLMHYVTHSFGELSYFIQNVDLANVGFGYTFYREFCALGVCDATELSGKMSAIAVRDAAVYGTIMTSLVYDFSVFSLIIFPVLFFIVPFLSVRDKLGFLPVILLIVLILSSIENYFYTGLGLVQILVMFFLITLSNFLIISVNKK